MTWSVRCQLARSEVATCALDLHWLGRMSSIKLHLSLPFRSLNINSRNAISRDEFNVPDQPSALDSLVDASHRVVQVEPRTDPLLFHLYFHLAKCRHGVDSLPADLFGMS